MHNVTRDQPERFGHVLVLQGKTQTHVPELHAGDLGAVAKLKDTHTSDTLGDKNAGFIVPPLKFPEPVLAYAIEPKSRGDEDKIGPAMQRLREEDPVDPLRPRSADARAAALRPGPAAHRSHGRQAAPALRRRGEPQTAADSLPRDDHREGRSARPAQEADRRPRPVRRLQDHDGAAAARRRLRVRQRHLRRRDSAAVRPGGRERASRRHASARLPDGLSGRRLSRHRDRRVVPRRRLERNGVQAGGAPGVPRRHVTRQADDPRADHERRGLRAVGLRRRSDGRSQQPARPHLGHGHPRRRRR